MRCNCARSWEGPGRTTMCKCQCLNVCVQYSAATTAAAAAAAKSALIYLRTEPGVQES